MISPIGLTVLFRHDIIPQKHPEDKSDGRIIFNVDG